MVQSTFFRCLHSLFTVSFLTICGGSVVLADVTSSTLATSRSVRLPNNTYPLHYYWHLHTNIHQGNLTYLGNVTIDIAVRETTDEVVLHARHLRNYAITLQDLQTEIVYDNVEYILEDERGFLIVNGPSPGDDKEPFFQIDHRYRLQILYDADMNENCLGIYWIAYGQPDEPSLIQ